MKVLSLFSGVGGFDLGLERAGMHTVFQCEWDKHATKILERHWPHVPRWDDVSTLTGKHILAHAPVIDIVAWGSPCQDLSVAGKRAGLDGERSGLFHQGIRIIKELLEETNGRYPRISLWENVYGALNSNKGADFGVILDQMAEAGSLVQEWRVLDAQYFRVPQRRRRVFLVSIFDPATAARCPDPLLPLRQGVQWNPATSTTPRQDTPSTTTRSVGSGGEVAGTLTWRMKNGYNAQDAFSNLLQVVNENYARPVGSAVLGSEIVGSLNAVDYKWPQNQQLDENKFIVVETDTSFTGASHADYREGVGTLRASGGDLGGGSETLLTFTKSKRAQTVDDNETWVEHQPAPTLNAFDQGDTRATTVVVNEAHDRTYRKVTGSLLGRDSFGPNHEGVRDGKLILEPMIAFSHTQGLSAQPSEDSFLTLRREGSDMAVAIPIHDQATRHSGKRGDKADGKGNGLGIGNEGDPMNTLTSGDRHAVAYAFDSLSSNSMKSSNPNSGVRETEVAKTLDTARPDPSCNQGGIAIHEPTMAVRRLTPVECERLMGWPDDWTSGQADTHRYKQCGNGVASPVAQWIAEQLLQLDKDNHAEETTQENPTT